MAQNIYVVSFVANFAIWEKSWFCNGVITMSLEYLHRSHLVQEQSVAHRLRTAMHQLASALLEKNIPANTWYYPYFSMGYMPLWKDRFLHLPWILELGHDLDGMCAVGYCAERDSYILSHINPCPDEQHFINKRIRVRPQK